MLSKAQQREIIIQEPKFIEKLQRMEALGMQLGKLLGHSIFTLQKSLRRPEGKWYLNVEWTTYGIGSVRGGHEEVTYVTLKERVKGWVRYKWVVTMQYQRNYETGARDEARHLFTLEDHVVAMLDTFSDELEEQIARASRATQEHKEEFRKALERRPRKVRSRFDQIDLLL